MSLNENLKSGSGVGATTANNGSSLASMLRGGSPLSRSGAGELVGQHARVFQEILDKQSGDFVKLLKVIPIDHKAAGVSMSSVALAIKDGDKVLSYLFLIEGTAPSLGSQTVKTQGTFGQTFGEVSIPYVASDVYRKSYWERVSPVIASAFGVKADSVTDVAASVIYSEISPIKTQSGEELEKHQPLLWAACQAIITYVRMSDPSFQDFNPTDLTGQKVTAKVSWMNAAFIDEAGQPVRANYVIETHAAPVGTNTDVAITGAQPLTQATGYVDLIQLTPEARRQAATAQSGLNEATLQMMTAMGHTANIPTWMPRVVCTYMGSLGSGMTINTMLMALATNALAIQNSGWRHAFGRKISDQYHSLTGLRFELQKEINVDDPEFSLTQFLAANMTAQPILSLLLPDLGPTSHVWNILRAACQPNHPNHARARQIILDGCNVLTGNRLGQTFPMTDAIGIMEDTRIPMGYYIGDGDLPRSLSDIDHLAVCNLSADPSTIMTWADSQNHELGKPSHVRTADTLNILGQLFQNNYKLKGWGQMVTLNPKFIVALYNALSDAAGGIRLDSSMETLDEAQRGMSGVVQYAINPTLLRTQQASFDFANNSGWGNQNRNNSWW